MAFDSLSNKLNAIFKKLRSKGKLDQADIKLVMREIKLALLEADVNFKVVKDFIARLSEKAVGAEILESLTPAQQVIKLVHEELISLMGSQNMKIQLASKPPTIIMLCGLQGAGKTTHAAKLALYFKKQGKRPLLAACDIYRPAAIDQLHTVGKQVEIPVFSLGQINPVDIAKKAVAHAKDHGNDIVFLDMAGRLHIDEALMQELTAVKAAVPVTETLLFIDAMTGQDAVNAAAAFNEALSIDGIVLTKTDGDTRGGAALSALAVTGKPIKFLGTGEKMENLEVFHPERMASRILGMGDVLSLIEKAEQNLDMKKAEELEKRLRANKFTLTDFLDQMGEIKKLGSMGDILSMMPGVNMSAMKDAQLDDKQINRMAAIIQSMTPEERENPEILNFSRKKRVAAGCGRAVEDVNRLLKQFDQMSKMLKQFSGMGKKGGKMPGLGGFKLPF